MKIRLGRHGTFLSFGATHTSGAHRWVITVFRPGNKTRLIRPPGTAVCAQGIDSQAIAGSSPGAPAVVPSPVKHHSRTIQLDLALWRTATNCNELQRIRASCRFCEELHISRFASALRKGRDARNARNPSRGAIMLW
jgi:hypothetical protein